MARGYLPAHWRNLILPDGAIELIINLGDPQTLCALDDPSKQSVFRHSWISGIRRMSPGWKLPTGGTRFRESGTCRSMSLRGDFDFHFTSQSILLDSPADDSYSDSPDPVTSIALALDFA
jgi:hypothetical protein